MKPLLLVTLLAVFLAIAYCQRPMMGRPPRPPQRTPSRPVNSRPNNSLNTTDPRQTVSVNGPALLFGIAGLAAVAGTAGFIGGLILGENDPGFHRRRPPFRGKRTSNVHHQISKSCENEEALLSKLNILENKQLNISNNNNEDNDGCNFFQDCCSQFAGNITTQISEPDRGIQTFPQSKFMVIDMKNFTEKLCTHLFQLCRMEASSLRQYINYIY